MNYLDYTIIGVIVFYGLWGLSKGLLKIILDFAGYIVAFFAAKLFSPMLVDYLVDTGIQTSIQNKLIETFNKIVPNISQSLESINLPSNLNTLLQQEPQLNKILESYPTLGDSLEQNMSELAGQGLFEVITEYILMILSIVAIFMLVKIVFSVIVSIILSRQDQMPLAFTNRILGLSLGLVIAFVLLSFAVQLTEVVALTSSPVISDAIATSKYGHIFTSIPLLDWLSKIL